MRDVEVEKVVDVKSKYEERFPLSQMVVRDACNEFDGNFDYVMGAEKKFRDFRLGEREFEVDGRLTFIYPDSCKGDDENLVKEKMRNELVGTVLPLLDEHREKLASKTSDRIPVYFACRIRGFDYN